MRWELKIVRQVGLRVHQERMPWLEEISVMKLEMLREHLDKELYLWGGSL
jgi:hypothetical protein